MTNDYNSRLLAARLRFREKTEGLSGRVLRLRLTALAGAMPGVGENQTDPFEQGLAEQALAGLALKDRIEASVLEHRKLSLIADDIRVPAEPHFQRDRRARLNELEGLVETDRDQLEALAQSEPLGARARAIAAYEVHDAQAARVTDIRAAAEAKVAAEPAQGGAVDALAATLLNRR